MVATLTLTHSNDGGGAHTAIRPSEIRLRLSNSFDEKSTVIYQFGSMKTLSWLELDFTKDNADFFLYLR